MTPANVRLGVIERLGRRLTLLQFQLIKAGPQHLPGLVTVLVLRTAGLARHDRIGRDVGQSDRGVRLVDVLTTRTGSAVGVGPHVGRVDVDLDGVIHDRRDPDRGERGVALGRRVIGADAHQAVHTRLRLHPAIGVGA